MNDTTFQPPIITDILTRKLVECFQLDGGEMWVWEEEVLDILDQRWLLTVCEVGSVREVANWIYLERVRSC
jgi:hypothetical protein